MTLEETPIKNKLARVVEEVIAFTLCNDFGNGRRALRDGQFSSCLESNTGEGASSREIYRAAGTTSRDSYKSGRDDLYHVQASMQKHT